MIKSKLVISVLIGNTMEFYDFIVFAFISKYMSELFFPSTDALSSYMATFVVFASGYLMRPIGSLFFGYIGDKYGRKVSLSYSVMTITVATFLIGLLPTYDHVGILAPILLTVCRLLQGFSVSGEEGGAAVYLGEMVGEKKIAYAGSLVLGSAYFGVLLGSLACLLLSLTFSAEQITNFAWRLPFFSSILLGIPSLILRRNLVESAGFKNRVPSANPVRELFRHKQLSLVFDTIMVSSLSIPIYLFTIFIPSYLILILHMDMALSQTISVISLIFLTLGVPILGKLADKKGITKIYIAGCLWNILLSYPAFALISSGEYLQVLAGLLVFGLGLLFIAGPLFAILILNYAPMHRFTAVSFTFNTSMSIFGSLTPMMAFYIISKTGNLRSPWILACSAGVVGILILAPKLLRWKKPAKALA